VEKGDEEGVRTQLALTADLPGEAAAGRTAARR
jgi:hypothetical protein